MTTFPIKFERIINIKFTAPNIEFEIMNTSAKVEVSIPFLTIIVFATNPPIE